MIQARGNLEARSFVRRDLTACEETRLQSLVKGHDFSRANQLEREVFTRGLDGPEPSFHSAVSCRSAFQSSADTRAEQLFMLPLWDRHSVRASPRF